MTFLRLEIILATEFVHCRKIGNMLAHKPQAIIFDLDGLIVDTEVVYRMAWQQSATDLGYCMSDDLYSSFVGRRTVDCKAIFVEFYGSNFPLSDFLVRSDQLYQEHAKRYGISTKPGLYELLDFLDARHLPKVVATSTERINALFCLGGLANRFTLIVTGDDVAQGKPAPDIFLLAATRLQLAPRQCLVLEDADAGVQAAHTAGIPVIIVPDLNLPSAQIAAKAACVCSSLHEVKDLLIAL
jgi:HAD superfamily hydrolase (TIGR01509 family)